MKEQSISISLTPLEWAHVLERIEDDDFYHTDEVAQKAVLKIRQTLQVNGIDRKKEHNLLYERNEIT